MSASLDDLIPSAQQIRKEAALKEAEKATEYARVLAAAEAEKHALIERLTRPPEKPKPRRSSLPQR